MRQNTRQEESWVHVAVFHQLHDLVFLRGKGHLLEHRSCGQRQVESNGCDMIKHGLNRKFVNIAMENGLVLKARKDFGAFF
jgi:hypothetical protein